MKQNKYDEPEFFSAYSRMPRSVKGLEAAGEWHALRGVLPDLQGKRVLDLGAGYGWHCRYAAEQGASSVLGIDISEEMVKKARKLNSASNIRYERKAVEDIDLEPDSFDVALSSLTLHYIRDLRPVFAKIAKLLTTGGVFCYSVEHPVFTSRARQDWSYNSNGEIDHWPVDDYFREGERETNFLGFDVIKYHRTIESHFNVLLSSGFIVDGLLEPAPQQSMVKKMKWENELRRPMMLILRATKT